MTAGPTAREAGDSAVIVSAAPLAREVDGAAGTLGDKRDAGRDGREPCRLDGGVEGVSSSAVWLSPPPAWGPPGLEKPPQFVARARGRPLVGTDVVHDNVLRALDRRPLSDRSRLPHSRTTALCPLASRGNGSVSRMSTSTIALGRHLPASSRPCAVWSLDHRSIPGRRSAGFAWTERESVMRMSIGLAVSVAARRAWASPLSAAVSSPLTALAAPGAVKAAD